jgi:uncharacterized protein (TIGR03435 family)
MPTPEFAASFGRLAANHLWQSTGFAAVAVLLALALRANHARARYWLWLAASVKFLVPFSVLAAIGSSLGRWFAPATPVSRLPFVMEQIVQPFAPFQDAPLPMAAAAPANLLPALLLSIWLCGFAAVLLYGWMRWRRVAAAVRSSTPLTEGRELEALRKVGQAIRLPTALRLVSSTAKLEPGVFGIFRPVLWLPAGIADRLDDAELEAILAHELCHVRRRDNLFASVHMAVEAIFWFHPLVWWLGARLTEERERACDEEVVRMGGEPQIYAESILKVCEFYLASPVACAAGVTGGELKKRIEGIMTNRFTRKLSYGKKILLAAAAILVIAGPIAVGLVHAQAPQFEVASVKPSPPPASGRSAAIVVRGGPGSSDPALARFDNIDLFSLVTMAYGIGRYQLSGPEWLSTARFDINARIPQGATRDQYRLMLQNLLAERFKLALHHETKEIPIYELVVAKNGSKLKESPVDPYSPDAGLQPPTRWSSPPPGAANAGGVIPHTKRPIEWLLAMLSGLLGQPVTDATGLKGEYDIQLRWSGTGLQPPVASDTPGAAAADSGLTLFEAVQEQLGLKLVQKKAPFDVLVIDHIEKVPTEN